MSPLEAQLIEVLVELPMNQKKCLISLKLFKEVQFYCQLSADVPIAIQM